MIAAFGYAGTLGWAFLHEGCTIVRLGYCIFFKQVGRKLLDMMGFTAGCDFRGGRGLIPVRRPIAADVVTLSHGGIRSYDDLGCGFGMYQLRIK